MVLDVPILATHCHFALYIDKPDFADVDKSELGLSAVNLTNRLNSAEEY
jgi:hypothetical protein